MLVAGLQWWEEDCSSELWETQSLHTVVVYLPSTNVSRFKYNFLYFPEPNFFIL